MKKRMSCFPSHFVDPCLTQKFNRDAPDYEKSLRVIVKANDKGTPSLEGTCAFIVTVLDVNDNSPLFDKRVSHIYAISEKKRKYT